MKIARNALGMLALLLAWYFPDRFFFGQREGFEKVLPYLLLSTMYVWIVIHNRVLLERFYLAGDRPKYFLITGTLMTVFSLNIYLVIHFLFNENDPLPQILGLWVFTMAGAGVYLLFKNEKTTSVPAREQITHFESILLSEILYIESLENYVRVLTTGKPALVRMTLKDAEVKLAPQFIRISRSHLVNKQHVASYGDESLMVNGQELKIGKVYKKYVMSIAKDMGR